MSKNASTVSIKNKKAFFEFAILEEFEAGIMLQGTEIKSIRQSKANIADAYCYFAGEALFVKNMNIAEYDFGNINNHLPTRERKLLLKKRELAKLSKKIKEGGNTIIPLHLYINEKGFAKLKIALAKGKKLFDKRETLKTKDVSRDLARAKQR